MDTNDSIQSGQSNSTMEGDRLLVCVSAPLAIFSFVFYAFFSVLECPGTPLLLLQLLEIPSFAHHSITWWSTSPSQISASLSFSMPIAVFGECIPWPLGEVGCRLLRPSFLVFTGVSVCTMMTLSCERYRAVTKPLAPKLTSKAALRIIVLIWILAYFIFGFSRSYVFGLTTKKGTLQCDPVVKNVILGLAIKIWRILSTLVAPGIVVCWTYIPVMLKLRRELDAIGDAYASRDMARSRVNKNAKTMRLLVAIISGFVVCFVPFTLIITIDDFIPAYREWPYNKTVESITRMLQVSHSCFNPIILCLMSLDFRHALMKHFSRLLKSGKR